MSTFSYPITIADINGGQPREVEVCVDTGTFFTTLPRPLLHEIGIEPTDTRYVPLADGQSVEQEIGHAQVALDDEQGITIVVFGDDDSAPLLGRYTLTGAVSGSRLRQPTTRTLHSPLGDARPGVAETPTHYPPDHNHRRPT